MVKHHLLSILTPIHAHTGLITHKILHKTLRFASYEHNKTTTIHKYDLQHGI